MGWRFRIVHFGSKPGKADGNASTNRAAVLPMRMSTKKNDLLGASGFPGSDLGAVEVNLGRCRIGGDLEFGEPTVARNHVGKAIDPELAIQSVDP